MIKKFIKCEISKQILTKNCEIYKLKKRLEIRETENRSLTNQIYVLIKIINETSNKKL